MTTTTRLTSVEQARELLASEDPVLVFKHSTRCPISARAQRCIEEYRAANPGVPVKWADVLVIEDRPVSDWLADELNTAHASPQLILILHGKAVWTESHLLIKETAITNALREFSLWIHK